MFMTATQLMADMQFVLLAIHQIVLLSGTVGALLIGATKALHTHLMNTWMPRLMKHTELVSSMLFSSIAFIFTKRNHFLALFVPKIRTQRF